ncbi:hypothetical protein [Nocardioides sp. AE5]|uniref:hypothetical protein n=1 Tax=Nocardioides sp. AE5 TaxID=2962573 RepID=UPI002881BEA6|nr:hypothetical protein [Nocardioides sp. AE5]MDT0201141.1 hypothetical protein [Nocardioides sp. AE5]
MSSGITDGSTQRQVLLPGLAVGVSVVVAIVGTLVSEVLAKSWDRFVEDYESVLAVWVLHSFTLFGVSGLVVDQPEFVSGGFPGFVAGILVLALVGFGVAAIGTIMASPRGCPAISSGRWSSRSSCS